MNIRSHNGLFFEFTAHFLALAAVFAALTVIFSAPSIGQTRDRTARLADSEAGAVRRPPLVIVDPGHGGADGGAVAPDGTCEKDINLATAETLSALFTSYGYECVMTREGDTMPSDGSGASKKLADLRARVKMTDGRDCVFISVHQNKFPQAECSGTQVYYSGNDARSARLAEKIRSVCAAYLQPGNTRQTKRAGSEIYVLDRCRCPAVLVECGFLSNPAELEKLKTEEYRKKLAAVIFASFTEYEAEEEEKYEEQNGLRLQ